jgi:hypothetical protein
MGAVRTCLLTLLILAAVFVGFYRIPVPPAVEQESTSPANASVNGSAGNATNATGNASALSQIGSPIANQVAVPTG